MINWYYDALKNYLKDMLNAEDKQICSINTKYPENLAAKSSLPLYYVEEAGSLNSQVDQTGADLKNEIRFNIEINLSVFSVNADDIVSSEEFFTNNFSSALNVNGSEKCLRRAEIMLSEKEKISHTSKKGMNYNYNDTDVYVSIIPLSLQGVILEKEIVNPTKVELDRNVQIDLILHLSLLQSLWKKIAEETGVPQEPYPVEGISAQQESADVSDSYDQRLKDIEAQADAMYNFQNLCKAHMTVKNNSFSRCYELMVTKNISITEASEIYHKEMVARVEKAYKNKQAYFQKGDPQINSILDLIIEDMKNRFGNKFSASIYGGSTYMRFMYDKKMGNETYPIFILSDDVSFKDYSNDEYINYTSSQEKRVHKYSLDAMPISLSLTVSIYAKNEEQIKEIDQAFLSNYGGVSIYVSDPRYEGEFRYINISRNMAGLFTEIKHSTIGNGSEKIYTSQIAFDLIDTVMYYKEYDSETLKYDRILQLRQLQMAIAYDSMHTEIFLARQNAEHKLKPLFVPKEKAKSILGSVFNVVSDVVGVGFDALLATESYKKLKYAVKNHLPIDRTEFEKEFQDIIKYYPELFEKVIAGYPIDKIIEEIADLDATAAQRINDICDRLNIPYKIANSVKARDNRALSYYYEVLINNLNNEGIDYAVSEYTRLVKIDLARKAEEQARRAAEEDDDYESSSSGGSILGTAVGTYIGTRGIRKDTQAQTQFMRDEAKRREKERKDEKWREECRKRDEQIKNLHKDAWDKKHHH